MTETSPTAIATDLLAQLEAAWNAGDGAAYGAPFASDADFVDIRGDHHRGAAAIGGGHQAVLDSIYRGSTTTYRVDGARHLAPACVLAHATATLDAPGGPLAGRHTSTVTAVLVQGDAGWRIAAFHNTLVTS